MHQIVADFFIILFDAITSNPHGTAHGREGYYFGENGEYTQLQVATAVSEALVVKGLTKSVTPTPFTEDEYTKEPLVSI